MPQYKIAFMGTPDFAVPALEALVAAGHNIKCVYTGEPKPSGRGHKLKLSPVQLAAEKHGLTIHTPKTLKTPEEEAFFKGLGVDIAIVVAYGMIIPETLINASPNGFLNIHGSLLPRWRGASPIQSAIMAGDKEIGITIMKIVKELDAGPMLLKESIPVNESDDIEEIYEKLKTIGANLIVETLKSDKLPLEIPQDSNKATFAPKIKKDDALLDWNQSAFLLHRKIMALKAWPTAFFIANNEPIKVLSSNFQLLNHDYKLGTLIDSNFTIACKDGLITLNTVQRPSKSAVSGTDFLNGFALKIGQVIK